MENVFSFFLLLYGAFVFGLLRKYISFAFAGGTFQLYFPCSSIYPVELTVT